MPKSLLLNHNKPCKIAIDGTAASGKGTISKELANRHNLVYQSSSLFYRHLGLQVIKNKIVNETTKIIFLSQNLDPKKIIDNDDLYTEDVSNITSQISTIAKVRAALLDLQRWYFDNNNRIIMDGRDIGTVIAPDADIKLFITATIKTRALRRYNQLAKENPQINLGNVERNLAERDHRDQNRESSPLKAAKDAIIIDNSNMNLNQTIEYILNL